MKAFFSKKPKDQGLVPKIVAAIPQPSGHLPTPFKQMAENKQKTLLGPGFSCQLKLQNTSGLSVDSIHNGFSQSTAKQIKLYSIKYDHK